jgi:LCP family protein required for cell wall assembly
LAKSRLPPLPPPPSTQDSDAPASDDLTVSDRRSLQATRRQEQKRLRKQRHRWVRRVVIGFGVLVLLAGLLGVGVVLYAKYRYDQIRKVHAPHLVKVPAPGKPFNILVVGSDSRAFVQNATQSKAFGSASDQGGQRSDVTMVVRIIPAAKQVWIMSIPRDLWVDIPANNSSISGMNRINTAFNSGPDLLIQTIEKDLGIPISHYISVNFDGFQNMVGALGGITMNFPTPVKDSFSGLKVTTTGCQIVPGTTALELVRARHLYYEQGGTYLYDGLSDFSRIQRQDAFFRAVLNKLNASITNPFALNGFIGAAVKNMTIDDQLGEGTIIGLARSLHGLTGDNLHTQTLPTYGFTTNGGAAVLGEAQPYARQMIDQFNLLGLAATPVSRPGPSTTTTPLATSLVHVQVLNGSGAPGIATSTGAALRRLGYVVISAGDASSFGYTMTQVIYGIGGETAANSVAAHLSGATILVPDSKLVGNNVTVILGSAFSGLTGEAAPTTSTTTTTTAPTTPGADIYTNTQTEPWNPVPCHL